MEYKLVEDSILIVMNLLNREISNKEIERRVGRIKNISGYGNTNIDSAISTLTENCLIQEVSPSQTGKRKYKITEAGKKRADGIYREFSGEGDPELAFFKIKDAMHYMFG